MALWKKVTLVVLACLASYVWYALFTLHPKVLTVSVLDVGQGDAIFIETPSGNQMLIDGGYGRKVLSELSAVIPAYDKSIDIILSTHTDIDHLGGLVEVLKSYNVGTAIDNSFVAQTDIYKNWEDSLSKNYIPEKTVRAGDRIMLDEGVEFDVFGPTSEDFEPMPKVANEVMIVGCLRYGNNSFLLMGDIERSDEIRLAQSSVGFTNDVLKVAHHGSKYASTDLFLKKVHPKYAVISVGATNRYGHPTSEVLDRLNKINAQILRTDQQGRITFTSDGNVTSVAMVTR
ncbi:MAG: ComEC/Rec2 family competence protein [Patescibacteria group bacterium]|mgnify:CR=1 FL=1